jgi:hypothetical protein
MVCAQTPAACNHDSITPFGFSTLGVKILDSNLKDLKAYKLAPKWCVLGRLPPATMRTITLSGCQPFG